jgi:putative ABC transport system ATP-binding protein
MASSKTIVKTIGLAKSYSMGESVVHALRGIDADICAGDMVGVVGPSGSGKSTLLHILGCLDTPTEGRYFLGGEDVSSLNDRELSLVRASRVGFIFQTFNLIPTCNVLENVAMPFLYRENSGQQARDRAEKALQRVGLSHRAAHKPAELSGGERQRVATARALVVEPVLVLADEPTGNLDTATSEDVLQLFRNLNDQGTTFVIATHDETVVQYCDRVIELRDGMVSETSQ